MLWLKQACLTLPWSNEKCWWWLWWCCRFCHCHQLQPLWVTNMQVWVRVCWPLKVTPAARVPIASADVLLEGSICSRTGLKCVWFEALFFFVFFFYYTKHRKQTCKNQLSTLNRATETTMQTNLFRSTRAWNNISMRVDISVGVIFGWAGQVLYVCITITKK